MSDRVVVAPGQLAGAELPPPLVRLYRHPVKWLWIKVQLLADVVVLAYVGPLIIVAVYYLIFEVWSPVTHLWHHAIPNASLRHDVRDVAEGLLGGLLAQLVVWNHYRRRVARPPNRFDRLEIALHIPNPKEGKRLSSAQLLLSPLLVLLYALPGFWIGYGITQLIHHHHAAIAAHLGTIHFHVSHGTSVWAKTKSIWVANWDKKLIGYFSAFVFGRRPAKGVFDDVQLVFAERRVANRQPLRWYHPPTFKARYNDIAARVRASGGSDLTLALETRNDSPWLHRLILGGSLLSLALAIFGWYVLAYIAKGK